MTAGVTRLLPDDSRQPVRFATYGPGIDDPDPGIPMGPNTTREWLWPVTVERSAVRTRVGFSFAEPPVAGVVVGGGSS